MIVSGRRLLTVTFVLTKRYKTSRREFPKLYTYKTTEKIYIKLLITNTQNIECLREAIDSKDKIKKHKKKVLFKESPPPSTFTQL
jgi:hypothetical protein